MKNLLYILVLFVTLFLSTWPTFAQSESNLEGNWLGSVEIHSMKMRVGFKISRNGETYVAKFDSIDQGVKDLEIDSVTQEGQVIKFTAAKLGFTYEGKLNEEGNEITGTLRQGPGSLPLVLKRVAVLPAVSRPQDPKKPYPYLEEEVTYKNTRDNVKLAGTLTLPATGNNHPAVILISGSGAQDRNETVAGHRPFLVLADALTRKGIAVLRVDDRGIGGSDLGPLTATSENYAEDVLVGVEYLKTRKEINPNQIGLIGHSEGGIIAPLAATRSNDVAFIVLLAGLGQTGFDVMYTQTQLIQKASGVPAVVTAKTVALLRGILEIIKTPTDRQQAERSIRSAIAQAVAEIPEEHKKAFAPIKTTMEANIPLYLSDWFRYFAYFDPQQTLKKVRVPVLALNGELDLQVAWKENLDLIAAALKAGENKDYTVKSFPKLNHLFQTSETGLLAEYQKIDETIAPQVLETISEWILDRTIKKK